MRDRTIPAAWRRTGLVVPLEVEDQAVGAVTWAVSATAGTDHLALPDDDLERLWAPWHAVGIT